jgi:hypothetical protein
MALTPVKPRRPREPEIVEDSYEPGQVEHAWREYIATHPSVPQDGETWLIFRAGWRRGFGQGTYVASTTFVHTREGEPR